ncbi:MAG TPA: protein kinase [Prosthecobacter sp.]|nr:protein kinase [Prosthecobacter sp.]
MSDEIYPQDSSPDSPPPRTTGGNWRWEPPSPEELQKLMPGYTIEKLLGRGGMGAVYRGIQMNLDRPVAIKILPPGVEKEDSSFAERFKNEAKLMAKLNHPAVVSVHDFGATQGGQLYFAMEYVDGSDVSQMIAAQGKLPPDHALAITAHVCDALAAAHELGIVHRDIKPANVLINMKGQVKVADFGLAKVEEPGQHGFTKTGYAMGTPDFVAPEALMLGMAIDGRADIYAVGVMLYQMLTGNIPRGAFKSAAQLVPGLDPRFDAIITKAMQSAREDRHQSAAELRRELDVILTVPLVRQDAPVSAAIPVAQVAQAPGQRSAAQRPAGRSDVGTPARKEGAHAGKSARTTSDPSAKSKAPLFISIGAIAAIGIGAFVMMSGKKEPTKPSTPAPSAAKPAPRPSQSSPSTLTSSTTTGSGTTPKSSSTANNIQPTATIRPQSGKSATVASSILPTPQPVQTTLPLKAPARPTQVGQIVVWRVDGKPMSENDAHVRPPADATASVHISANAQSSGLHAAALQSDGTVRVWGKISPTPDEVRDVADLAASSGRVLAINANGEFFAWGSWSERADFIRRIQQGSHKIVQIAAGAGYDYLLTDQGRILTRSSLADRQADIDANGPFQALVNGSGKAGAITLDGRLLELHTPNNAKPNLKPLAFLRAQADAFALNHETVIASKDGKLVGAVPESQASSYAGVTRIVADSSRIQAWRMADGAWKFVTGASSGTISIPHCEQQAEGCFDIALAGDYAFGLKAEADSSLAGASTSNLPSAPSTPVPAAFPPGQWVKVFTKFEDLPDSLRQPGRGVKFEDGWIRFEPGKPLRIYVVDSLTNYAIRATMQRAGDEYKSKSLMIRAAHGTSIDGYLLHVPNDNSFFGAGRRVNGGTATTYLWKALPHEFQPPRIGQEYTLEWGCVGDKLIARYGTHFVKTVINTDLKSGPAYLTGEEPVRDIEAINLDGLPEAEALKLLGVDEKGNDLRALAAQQERQQMEQSQKDDALAAIPELKALHEQFVKLQAERVTAPFEAEVAKLNASYLGGIDREIANEKKAGHLDGVIALESEKKIIADKQPVPAADDAKTPEALKKLRAIYRDTHAKIDASRAANLKALTDPLITRLKQLVAELTRQDRVAHAKTVREYREALEAGRPAAPPAAASGPAATNPANAALAGASALPAKYSKGDDRRAAEWALSLGGAAMVTVQYQGTPAKELRPGDDLPKQDFAITKLDLAFGSASAPPQIPITDLDVLAGLQELQRLRLSGSHFTESMLRILPSLPKLDELVLSEGAYSDGVVDQLKLCKSLTVFTVETNKNFTGSRLAELTPLKLTTLSLRSTGVSASSLGFIGSLDDLNSLTLWFHDYTDDDMRALAGLTRLESLNLIRTRVSFAGLGHFAKNRQLTTLGLIPPPEEATPEFAHVVEIFPKLTHYRMKSPCTRRQVAALAAFRNLFTLTIEDEHATDESVLGVLDLPRLKYLRLNYGGGENITPAAFQQLAAHKGLERINSDGLPLLTDDALMALADMRQLKQLELGPTPKLTAAGIAAFKKKRPDVKVTR